jgi:hypothetical protein
MEGAREAGGELIWRLCFVRLYFDLTAQRSIIDGGVPNEYRYALGAAANPMLQWSRGWSAAEMRAGA